MCQNQLNLWALT